MIKYFFELPEQQKVAQDFAMSEDSLNLVLQKNNQTKPHQAWQKYK